MTHVKVLLLAEEAAGLRALRAIASRDLDLVAVVTSAADAGSLSSIEDAAKKAGCQVWRPEGTRLPDFGERMREIGVDILLNVHSLFVLSGSVVEAPRIGSFNLHPGPLPEMAGLNAPSWAIYLGEKQHAVTLHWMYAGIDTGPIAYIERFDLGDRDTGLSVSNTCVRLGVPLIEKLLDTAETDPSGIPTHQQDLSARRVFLRSDVPNGGRIDWTESAKQITAFVRAADYGPFPSPWGYPRTRAGESELGIVRARVIDEATAETPGRILSSSIDGVAVASGDGVVLVQTVEAGGRKVDASDRMIGVDALI
jgi:methionyl-tRNA formyltransferase